MRIEKRDWKHNRKLKNTKLPPTPPGLEALKRKPYTLHFRSQPSVLERGPFAAATPKPRKHNPLET